MRAEVLLGAPASRFPQGLVDRRLEIERRKVLAVVADADTRANMLALGVPGRERFEERRFADAVRTSEEQVLFFPQDDVHPLRDGLVMLDDAYRLELQYLAAYVFLAGDHEVADRLIFPADLNDVLREFGDLFVHLAGDVAHVAALLGEEAGLHLAVLNVFLEANIFHPLAFEPILDLKNDVEVVAGVLLHLVRENLEIEHAVRERVQEVRIVGDDDAGFRVFDEEFREVSDALLIEVVRRFIEKQDVRTLDEGLGE